MSKKQLTAREARRRKNKRAAIISVVGSIAAAGVLVGIFIATQGDVVTKDSEPVKNYTGKTDSSIEDVKSDGSDPSVEGFVTLGAYPLDKDLPELMRPPRLAWESLSYTATNRTGGGEEPSANLNYLWKLTDSSNGSATYVTDQSKKATESQPSCSVTLTVKDLDKAYSSDVEATESIVGDDYVKTEAPSVLWTSYNLREYYDVDFVQAEKADGSVLLARGLSQNGVSLESNVNCDEGTSDADKDKAVSDANSLLVGIVPVEVK